jgi:hypothetical protein
VGRREGKKNKRHYGLWVVAASDTMNTLFVCLC